MVLLYIRKEFASSVSKLFPSREDPFFGKGMVCSKANGKSQKLSSFYQMVENLPGLRRKAFLQVVHLVYSFHYDNKYHVFSSEINVFKCGLFLL